MKKNQYLATKEQNQEIGPSLYKVQCIGALIGESSLSEYAQHFWNRQRKKNDPQDRNALADLEKGYDPLRWLRDKYPYKLPHPLNSLLRIVELNQEEVENLAIHNYMINDAWMNKARGITVESGCCKLKDLAMAFHKQRYFERDWDDTQIKCYRQWKKEKSLEGKIAGLNRTLIEQAETDTYEIVDGWGRLLPYVTLIIEEGFKFYPVETFLACGK